MNEGWVCPRCGRVNALFTLYCDCKANISQLAPNPKHCDHIWEYDSIRTNGTHYICKKCGKQRLKFIIQIFIMYIIQITYINTL